MASHLLKVYPIDNHFISSINYTAPENSPQNAFKPEFMVILDRSGSMGGSVRRIVSEILPIMFNKLNYQLTDKIHLVSFSDSDEYHFVEISQLTEMTNFIQNKTFMFPAIRRSTEIFQKLHQDCTEALRILAISDGQIFDQDQTEAAASELAKFVKTFPIEISSQAIRWEQKSADTRALCSLLQLSNARSTEMVNTRQSESNNDIADSWARLFIDDQMSIGTTLMSNEKVFLRNPWDEEKIEKIRLQDGNNTVWMSEIPNEVKLDDVLVNIRNIEDIDYKKLHQLMENKYDNMVNQMKVLKVINTRESTEMMNRIINYFKGVESAIKITEDTNKFSKLLESIANDENVVNMSPDELKIYLEPKEFQRMSQRNSLNDDNRRISRMLAEEARQFRNSMANK